MGEKRRLTKNEKKRLKKKIKRDEETNGVGQDLLTSNIENDDKEVNLSKEANEERGNDEVNMTEDEFNAFQKVLEKFALPKEDDILEEQNINSLNVEENDNEILGMNESEAIAPEEDTELSLRQKIQKQILEERARRKVIENSGLVQETKRKSKKELKKIKMESIAKLKQNVLRPDLVEAHDVSSSDPEFHVFLKTYPYSVQIPRHWSSNRRYLSHKRSTEAGGYKIPQFLVDAGVKLSQRANRADLEELDEDKKSKTAKQSARERIRPKLGKVDLDYQKLHDAFFKYQSKHYLPGLRTRLTNLGDLYYENKEYDPIARFKNVAFSKTKLSSKLRTALGMNSSISPPPWLQNMQRYGPPASYPGLRIPGLNAPIPVGATFGNHPNGWGQPPVDQLGRPIYGMEVFAQPEQHEFANTKPTYWGSLPEENEDMDIDADDISLSDNENSGEEENISMRTDMEAKPSVAETYIRVPEATFPEPPPKPIQKSAGETKQLYTVLEEKKVHIDEKAIHGSTHVYSVPPIASASSKAEQQPAATKPKPTAKSSEASNFKF